MGGTKEFRRHAVVGEDADRLEQDVQDINYIATAGKLDVKSVPVRRRSIFFEYDILRASSGNPAHTFQTCELADYKKAFWMPSTPNDVVQEGLNTKIIIEQMVELAQTLKNGLPPENSPVK